MRDDSTMGWVQSMYFLSYFFFFFLLFFSFFFYFYFILFFFCVSFLLFCFSLVSKLIVIFL